MCVCYTSNRFSLTVNPLCVCVLQREHVRPGIVVRGNRDRAARSNGLACKCFEGHRLGSVHPVDRGPGWFDLENVLGSLTAHPPIPVRTFSLFFFLFLRACARVSRALASSSRLRSYAFASNGSVGNQRREPEGVKSCKCSSSTTRLSDAFRKRVERRKLTGNVSIGG